MNYYELIKSDPNKLSKELYKFLVDKYYHSINDNLYQHTNFHIYTEKEF